MIRRRWSKARVLEEVRASYRKVGNVRAIRHLDPNLYAAAKRYFGNWRGALKAAGLKPVTRTWSHETVITALQRWRESGRPISDVWKYDSGLTQAAARYYGSWTGAVVAAGLEPTPSCRWTKQTVVDTIRTRYRSGTPLKCSTSEDRSLYRGAMRCFGSWGSAMRAAGLEPRRRKWSKERIVEELRRRWSNQRVVWKDDPGLAVAAKAYFGSRRKALLAVGFAVPERRKPTRWNQERVIAELRAWHERRIATGERLVVDCRVYAAARHQFGGWLQALAAAGISAARPKWDKPAVIRAIQDIHRQGIPLSSAWEGKARLQSAAWRHLGSWREALVAAGVLSVAPASQHQWTRQEVTGAIKQWHDDGAALNRVWTENKPLFRAAVRHFGGWRAALVAAEFEPPSRRKWSKERLLDEIRSRYLLSAPRLGCHDPGLVAAATYHFGSWRTALDEAGVERGRKWNKRRVVEAIQDRHVQGLPLRGIWSSDRALGSAAKDYFGSWKAALSAAGLAGEYREPKAQTRWSKQRVVEAIQRAHRDGCGLSRVWRENETLYCAAKKYFGTWRNAVSAAGLEVSRRRWSRQAIVHEIQGRVQEGRTLSSRCSENYLLYAAAIRYFGSWRKALRAAGVRRNEVAPGRQRTTPCRVKR